MCGRYVRRRQAEDRQSVPRRHVVDFSMADADYNVAPSTFQPITRQSRDTGELKIVQVRCRNGRA